MGVRIRMSWVESKSKNLLATMGGTSIRHSKVGTKFRLKLTQLNVWIELTQKGYFRTKISENYHGILHIQINLDSKIQLQQTF